MKAHQTDELAEQLLDTKKSERPKEHVLKSPKKPTAEEKEKAAKQRKATRFALKFLGNCISQGRDLLSFQ